MMEQQGSASRTKKIIGMGILFFIVIGCLIMLICNVRTQYVTQSILNQERELQQIWLNRAIDSIASWRNELVGQALFVSSSEMFRLFIADAQEMEKEHFDQLHEPGSLHSSNETLRSMAEQLSYLRDLLRDLTQRRSWNEARILLPEGHVLIGPEFSASILPSQQEICQKALEIAKPVFGPLRSQNGILTMDMADPLFEVLGTAEPKPIGVLLLSIPMEKPLTTFLSNQTEKREGIMPRIVSHASQEASMALVESGIVVLETLDTVPARDYPFMERLSLDGQREVFSMGTFPSGLNWQYILEIPAQIVETKIQEQKIQIYALGAFASFCLALLAAFIWAMVTNKQHKAMVAYLTKLNRQIDQQKTMLESINSSMTAGLLLVDDHDCALVTNPNFVHILDKNEPIAPHTPLAEIIPPQLLLPLQHKIREVMNTRESQSGEIEIGKDDNRRLYRVTYYPYLENAGTSKEYCAGCVAVFQDITLFRKRAQIQKEREEAMLSALGRAIESIDPTLVGQSDKMAKLSALLADQMKMSEDDKAALRISARLSQVGKLFVPRELLTREGKLTPEELAEVRRAPEYADKILNNLHFDLPIRTIVAEMGQKVDEKGNIKGTSTPMSQCGRVLGVINAFIAMTSPRSWRSSRHIEPVEAIEIMRASPDFWPEAVTALAQLSPDDINQIIRGSGEIQKN